jgi:hypothetical protein
MSAIGEGGGACMCGREGGVHVCFTTGRGVLAVCGLLYNSNPVYNLDMCDMLTHPMH